jgi:T5SS/PEP-CTERM-associated repeat protein
LACLLAATSTVVFWFGAVTPLQGDTGFVISEGLQTNYGGLLGVSSPYSISEVTGVGSTWTPSNGVVVVGVLMPSNMLSVVQGAEVNGGADALGQEAGSFGNYAEVTGAGSIWSFGSLDIGLAGGSNDVYASDGGVLFGPVRVGVASARNRLILSMGGRALSSCFVGVANTASNNSVLLTGAGTGASSVSLGPGSSNYANVTLNATVTNEVNILGGSNNAVDVTRGGTIGAGFDPSGISGGNDNTFTVTGGQVQGLLAMSGGYRNRIAVENSAVWWLAFYQGAQSVMTITNGGSMTNTAYTYAFGNTAASTNNTLTLSGAGTVWTNEHRLTIGGGGGNTLNLFAGAQALQPALTVGAEPASISNQINVAGSDSRLEMANDLTVGWYGVGNRVFISDGGQVVDDTGYVGYQDVEDRAGFTGTIRSGSSGRTRNGSTGKA